MKQKKIIEDLPENATWDDLMYQIYVKKRVETGMKEIENGDQSFAQKTDGTVWAWGHNIAGKLGDGTTTMQKLIVQVAPF